jgi:hypothetical protein
MAQAGGATPAASAALRAKWRSKPAGVQAIKKRAGESPRLVNACATPPGTKTSSPDPFVTSSSSTWKVS